MRPEEVAEVLCLAELIGPMAVLGVAELAHNDELAHRVLAKVNERAGE